MQKKTSVQSLNHRTLLMHCIQGKACLSRKGAAREFSLRQLTFFASHDKDFNKISVRYTKDHAGWADYEHHSCIGQDSRSAQVSIVIGSWRLQSEDSRLALTIDFLEKTKLGKVRWESFSLIIYTGNYRKTSANIADLSQRSVWLQTRRFFRLTRSARKR